MIDNKTINTNSIFSMKREQMGLIFSQIGQIGRIRIIQRLNSKPKANRISLRRRPRPADLSHINTLFRRRNKMSGEGKEGGGGREGW